MRLGTGIHKLSAQRYHADPCAEPSLSNSIAKILLAKTPHHAMHAHPRLNPDREPDESSRWDLGTAAHSLLLERDASRIVIVKANDWRTKAAQEARDDARAVDKIPMLECTMEAVIAMVKEARAYISQSEIADVFDTGAPEQTIIWQENGVWCRIRPDWLTGDYRLMLDYKTTKSAAPEACTRTITNMGYDIQGTFYPRGVRAVTDVTPSPVFLFQEIEPPYACSLMGLSEGHIEIATVKVERAINTWRTCIKSGKWPGYSPRIAYAEPTPWAVNEYMNQMEESAEEIHA